MSQTSPPSSDEPLLSAWVRRRDEGAFRALAEKYTALVFGTALRKTGRADWAEDVTQEVFVTFARRAPGLDGEGGLAGWLHRTAVLTAATRLRAESRRDQRMQKLAALSAHTEDPAPPAAQVSDRDWSLLRPVLDDAIAALPALDRRVILEHYFERKTYAEVAARAGLTHEAARKRGLRALEKLNRRGAALPVTILGGGLTAAFRQSAPAALAAKAGTAGIASAGTAFMALGGVTALFFVTMKTTIIPAAVLLGIVGLAGWAGWLEARGGRERGAAAGKASVTTARAAKLSHGGRVEIPLAAEGKGEGKPFPTSATEDKPLTEAAALREKVLECGIAGRKHQKPWRAHWSWRRGTARSSSIACL